MRYTFELFVKAVELNGFIIKSTQFTTTADKFIFECPRCHEDFERKGSKALLKDRTPYCRKCSCEVHAESKVKPELVICKKCGGRKSKKRTSDFCNDCWKVIVKTDMSKYRLSAPDFKGDKNPSWVGGVLSYWKRQVVAVGKCDVCAYIGTALNAHHLYAKSTHPELSTEITNGVCICANCHQEFHLKYGNEITPKDYIEFKGFKHGN
jgi:hypothetical protein